MMEPNLNIISLRCPTHSQEAPFHRDEAYERDHSSSGSN